MSTDSVRRLRFDPTDPSRRILTMRESKQDASDSYDVYEHEYVLDQQDQERILEGFGFGTVGDKPLAEDDACARIAAFAATIVKAPQLLVIIVSTTEIAAYRSNILGGNLKLPAVLRELADKIPTVST